VFRNVKIHIKAGQVPAFLLLQFLDHDLGEDRSRSFSDSSLALPGYPVI
jgi:hypothetical protein